MTRKSTLQRHDDAITRHEATASLTPEERLARLDARLGTGQGAHRERLRLEKQIAQRLTK